MDQIEGLEGGLKAWVGEEFDSSGPTLTIAALVRAWHYLKGEKHLRLVKDKESP